MLLYLGKRVALSFLTVLGVIAATFLLMRLAGDPAALLLPAEAGPADLARLRAALGLDRPLYVQFFTFLAHGLVGDFGDSIREHVPALHLVIERVPATLELAFSAFLVGIVTAFLCGLAIRLIGSSALRTAVMWLALARQAMPVFSFGILAILVFSVWLQWLPSLGRGSFSHLILPAFTLGTYELALYLRLFNLALSAEQRQDYVRTAYAKGQSRTVVILRHMLPNALLPLVTVAGINLGLMLGGAVVTETVFSWPGVGRLIVDAVSQRDFPVVIAGVTFVSLIFVLINLAVDVLYSFLDPRVKLG